MKTDPNVWSAQKGNWVWVHTGSKKLAGQIVEVPKNGFLDDSLYVIELKDGSHMSALRRELKRCRPPKRIRNADWLRKQTGM